MKREDFIFDYKNDEYGDYWFKVRGETQKELTQKYMEQSMVAVIAVCYSIEENWLVVQRRFPFNFDNIFVIDEELKEIILSLIENCDIKHHF